MVAAFPGNLQRPTDACLIDQMKEVKLVESQTGGILTLSPQNKLSSAKFLICFNFQSASMSLKVGENVAEY